MDTIQAIERFDIHELAKKAQRWEERGASQYSLWLIQAYKIAPLRPLVRKLTLRLEGGRFFSRTWREILKQYHGVQVGMYSYGFCLVPGALPPGTVVGNYSTVGTPTHVYRRDHTVRWISQHPFFYNHECGILQEDTIEAVRDNPLTIGHDVFVGRNSIILPRCKTIGDGAVIGSGAVVTKDVEPFTVVGGNPARVIRRRFSPEITEYIRESEWWNVPIPELIRFADHFIDPVALEFAENLRDRLNKKKQVLFREEELDGFELHDYSDKVKSTT